MADCKKFMELTKEEIEMIILETTQKQQKQAVFRYLEGSFFLLLEYFNNFNTVIEMHKF